MKDIPQFSFEGLDAYQESLTLVTKVYELAKRFPTHEQFCLASQIHRAIVSVPSNLAEGCGRISYKEKIRFIEIAYGSLLEAFCQLQIAYKLNYINEADIQHVKPSFFVVTRLLKGLSASYQRKIE